MPNIIKSRNTGDVKYNEFNNVFGELLSEEEESVIQTESFVMDDDTEDFPVSDSIEQELSIAAEEEERARQRELEAEEFVAKVRERAEELSKELLDKARTEAKEEAQRLHDEAFEEGRSRGYKEGYNDGYSSGYVEAYEKGLKAVNQDCDRFLCEIQAGAELFREEKQRLEEKHIEGMKELSVSIAEKVVGMNLESQNEVIKQMIVNALESSKAVQWIKIHISGFDAERYFEIEKELLDAIRHISDFVRVEVIDGADPGTCIIEMPDKIIDASINTQISNIKNMLDN